MDWKTGIEQLMSRGVSVKDISIRTGLSASSIYDLKNGYSTEPRGMAAVELFALLGEKLGSTTTKAA